MKKISGVYKITNKITGDFYIGSSNNIKKRWSEHKRSSTQARLPNSKLYQAFAKYGLENFSFDILEETFNLKEREQYYIDKFQAAYNTNRAKDLDIERRKKCQKEYYESHLEEHRARKKEWYKIHREEQIAKSKEYNKAHRERKLAFRKKYNNKICLYEGKKITLNALTIRFYRKGIPHPNLEAKKYLIEN